MNKYFSISKEKENEVLMGMSDVVFDETCRDLVIVDFGNAVVNTYEDKRTIDSTEEWLKGWLRVAVYNRQKEFGWTDEVTKRYQELMKTVLSELVD